MFFVKAIIYIHLKQEPSVWKRFTFEAYTHTHTHTHTVVYECMFCEMRVERRLFE